MASHGVADYQKLWHFPSRRQSWQLWRDWKGCITSLSFVSFPSPKKWCPWWSFSCCLISIPHWLIQKVCGRKLLCIYSCCMHSGLHISQDPDDSCGDSSNGTLMSHQIWDNVPFFFIILVSTIFNAVQYTVQSPMELGSSLNSIHAHIYIHLTWWLFDAFFASSCTSDLNSPTLEFLWLTILLWWLMGRKIFPIFFFFHFYTSTVL